MKQSSGFLFVSEGFSAGESLGFGHDLFGRLDDDIFGASGKIGSQG